MMVAHTTVIGVNTVKNYINSGCILEENQWFLRGWRWRLRELQDQIHI